MIINEWEHTGWGDSIYFFIYETRKLVGWLERTPEKGDMYRVKMTSGKIAEFKILKVEPCNDPKDMFFATTSHDFSYVVEERNPPGGAEREDSHGV